MTTPLDPIDPVEFRARGIYARDGDGLIHFRGPSLLVRNSGVQSLAIDVKNISAADANYAVSVESLLVTGNASATTSVAAGGVAQVRLPVDTTGLAPGQYTVNFTLRSAAGEIIDHQFAVITVVDLSVPENQEAARAALASLAALPPGSGLDPSVLEQVVAMFEEAMPSWAAEVHVRGRIAFDAVYRIGEPSIARSPGRVIAQSLPDTAVCVVNIMRAGKAASGSVRLQQSNGQLLIARINGRWDEATRTLDGTWLDDYGRGGAITIRLREP